MRLTNALKLPEPIVAAITNDDYSRGESDISVTQLIQPPRKVELERLHDHEIEEDVSDNIWRLVGQVAHTVLERANRRGVAERRLYLEMLGWQVSGKTDHLALLAGDGFGLRIDDWKFTTVWAVKGGTVKAEWVEQLNLYAVLLRANGYNVREAQITAILRDWSKLEALRNRDYPRRQVAVFPVELWPEEQAYKFMMDRVLLHQQARQQLPECSDEDRWFRGESWAVYRNDNQKATRVLDTPLEADQYIAKQIETDANPKKGKPKKNTYRVEHRPGTNTRCESYCGAAPFCDQWKQLQQGVT